MYAKNFSSETSLSMSSCVDVQLIYRSFVLNFLSARRELTSKHTIAYDISNQHHKTFVTSAAKYDRAESNSVCSRNKI